MSTEVDPLALMMTATDVIPVSERLAEFMDSFKELKFCCGKRTPERGVYDHDDCEPVKDLESALDLMKALNLSVNDCPRPQKGSRPKALAVLLYERFTSKNCAYSITGHEKQFDKTFGKEEIETINDAANYIMHRVKVLGISQAGVVKKRSDTPKFFNEGPKARYWHETSPEVYEPLNETMVQRKLIQAGLDRYPNGNGLSEVEQALVDIVENDGVDVATPLAGYKAGFYELNGARILVTRSFNLIEPATEDGDHKHIRAILWGLLKDPQGKNDIEQSEQYWCLLTHLQRSYIELRDGVRTGSMAVFLCGPKDTGKSLLLELIVALLGGRYSGAHLYISGQTSFTDELMMKENWVIDDGSAVGDYAARKKFSDIVKQSVAAGHAVCHAKGKAQLSLPIFRRLWVALNPDDLETLPYLSESLEDKYALIQTHAFTMPKGCMPLPDRQNRAKFMATLMAEMPFFIQWLLAQDLSAYAGRRFGVVAHKNQELVAANAEACGLDVKYGILCEVLFGTEKRRETDAVEMTSTEIWIELSSDMHSASLTLPFRNVWSLGKALRELSTSPTHRHLVSQRTLRGKSRWTIRQDEVETSTASHHIHRSKRSENKEDCE